MIYDSNTLQIRTYYNGEKVTPVYQVTSDIATIDQNGLLTFSDYGEVQVTVTYNGESITRTYTYSSIRIVNGYELTSKGAEASSSTMSVVGPINCNSGIQITWGVEGGSMGNLCEYNDSGGFIDYWGATMNPRTKGMSNNTKMLKATFQTSYLDYSYIHDNTNSVYLWKGINVT